MNEEGFYVVWNPEGSNPKFRHDDEGAAIHEAQRLAANNPGKAFYVLLAISRSEKLEVLTQRLREPQLPF